MWHIVLMGYVFTTLMFALVQGSVARMAIYVLVYTVLPVAFALWVAAIRLRNRRLKQKERTEHVINKNGQ